MRTSALLWGWVCASCGQGSGSTEGPPDASSEWDGGSDAAPDVEPDAAPDPEPDAGPAAPISCWEIETVTETLDPRESDAAVGADGTTQAVWIDAVPRWASDAGGEWALEGFEEGFDPDGDPEAQHEMATPSIALEADGTAHVVLVDRTAGALVHARRAPAGGWTVETAASPAGRDPDLAIDARGALFVARFDDAAGDLRVATNASGAWVDEVVASEGEVGEWPSIALGPDGAVHVAFWNRTWNDLQVATKRDGAWDVTTVAAEGATGWFPSIGVAPDGTVHVAYFDRLESEVRHARTVGADWQTETLAEQKRGGGTISLAVDGAGGTSVAWLDGDRLRFATDAWGGGWSIDRIEATVGFGGGAAVAALPSGGFAVVYDDGIAGEIRRARRAPPSEAEGCGEVAE